MNKLPLALAVTLAASTAVVGVAVSHEDARVAAANGLELSTENVTAPEDVGRRIDVEVNGDITALNPRKGPRRCRGSRDVRVIHRTVAQEKRVTFPAPSSRKGHFTAGPELEYAVTDDEGFHDGDVPESGGRVTFTVKVKPTEVPAGGPRDLELFQCKKLKGTTTVDVPPARR